MRHINVFLNGPPRSGKDTAANGLVDAFSGRSETVIVATKFAAPIKRAVNQLLGKADNWEPLPQYKNRPIPELGGMSWREACIWYSEEVMKPKFGPGIFGSIAAREYKEFYEHYLSNSEGTLIHVFSDSGFLEEFLTFSSEVAIYKPTSIIIQLSRVGCSFDGDSREYVKVPHDMAHTYEVWNSDDQIGILQRTVVQIVERYYEGDKQC